jgi:hypothetical protein
MTVTKSDFIEIGARHAFSEREAVQHYDQIIDLGFDPSRMTRADLEEYFHAVSVLRIDEPSNKPPKKGGFISRLFGK